MWKQTSKQINRKAKQTKMKTLVEQRHEVMEYSICLVNAHA